MNNIKLVYSYMIAHKAFLFFIFILLAHNGIGFSQNKDYTVKYLTIRDGLSHNEVSTIIKDKAGFMWFGTRGGLNRYDGYTFEKYIPQPEDLKNNNSPIIEEIYEDRRGNIWIGTASGGLLKYSLLTEQFTSYSSGKTDSSGVSALRVISFYEDSDDFLWIGTWSGGLNKYNYRTNKFTYYLENEIVSEIIEDRNGSVWAISYYGLWKYDEENDIFINVQIPGIHIGDEGYVGFVAIEHDPHQPVFWIGGWGRGLIRFNYEESVYEQFMPKNSDNGKLNSAIKNIYSLLIDNSGTIWTGTWGNGLWRFDRELRRFSQVNLLSYEKVNLFDQDVILELMEDREGNIWIGTNGAGVIKLSRKLPFNNLIFDKSKQVKKQDIVLSIFEDRRNNLFFTTLENGLFWYKEKKGPYHVLTKDNKELFETNLVFQRNNGKIWIGGYLHLYELEWSNKVPWLIKCSEKYNNPSFDIKKVTSIVELGNSIFIGTKQQGLYFFTAMGNGNAKLEKHYISEPEKKGFLQNERINHLLADSKNRLWVGTHGGLHLALNDSIFFSTDEFIEENKKLTCDVIHYIFEDHNRDIWVSTPCGINKLTEIGNNKFSLKLYTKENGLAEDIVHGIIEDTDNNLWFSANSSILKFDSNNQEFTNFFQSDGIEIFNFHKGIAKNDQGRIFMGGLGGITYFDPKQIIRNKIIPNIAITSFKILNKPVRVNQKFNKQVILNKSVNEAKSIILTHRENEFSFEISALDYSSPERNQYAYKLDGYNDDWITIGNRRRISFSNLKSGEYKLRVRGSNKRDIRNNNGKELQIIILPPWWTTWYAILFYVLFLFAILILVRWVTVKQTRLSTDIELLKVKNEKESAINEMKLRFFTNISHELRTPLTLIIAPLNELLERTGTFKIADEVSNKLNIIKRNAQRLLNLTNQLLEFRKVESGFVNLRVQKTSINEFLQELCANFYEIARINNIKFQLMVENQTNDIWFDRDKFEMIISNLVSNSFKYVKSDGEVMVKITEIKEFIRIHVIDNGIGIPHEELDKIFERFYQVETAKNYSSSGIGLALVKNLVKLHSGKIEVNSEPLVKTEFVISMLKGNAHFTKSQIAQNLTYKKQVDVFEIPVLGKKLGKEKKIDKEKNRTVLVVEDNEEIRNYLEELLSSLYSVITAVDGEDGLDKTMKHMPDLVVSDIMMPRMDGFEYCQKVKENAKTKYIPIILLTAKSAEQYEIFGVKLGADAYISKPFDPKLIKEKINALLNSREQLKQLYSQTIKVEASEIEITSYDEELIKNAIHIVESNLLNPEFNADYLAENLFLSHSSLYRKLKKYTGYSINGFIRKIKLDIASQMLKNEEKTISEIAFDIGFKDVKYFRDCFQKQFSKTPSEYRKSL